MTGEAEDKNAIRAEARHLLLSGHSPAEVAARLKVNINTLYTWQRRGGWKEWSGNEQAFDATLRAYLHLVERAPEHLTPRELSLLERYAGLLVTLAPSGDRKGGDHERA